jgi:hypothetical protein
MRRLISLVRDSHGILAGWRNLFSQLLNVHGVKDVKHTETYTTEPIVFEPIAVMLRRVLKT